MTMESHVFTLEQASAFLLNICKIGLALTVLCVFFFDNPSVKQVVLGVVFSLVCAALGLSLSNKAKAVRSSRPSQVIKLRR